MVVFVAPPLGLSGHDRYLEAVGENLHFVFVAPPLGLSGHRGVIMKKTLIVFEFS